jgi:hypothetical protein
LADNKKPHTANTWVEDDKPAVQIYPNPFTDMVSFNFRMTTPSKVEFVIYNSVGQIVKKEAARSVGAGADYRTVFLKGNNVPGVYIYLLRVNDKIVHRGRIVLVR